MVVVSGEPFSGEAVAESLGLGGEVPGLRTAFSSSFSTDVPGVFRMVVSDEPVHFRSRSGNWRRIDTTLVEIAEGGGFRSAANSTRVEVADVAHAAVLGAVRLADGTRAGFSLEGALEVEPSVLGSTSVFEGARAGVDVVLEATPAGLKETLVLAGPSAPRSFVFPLVLEGLVAVLDEGSGAVELREAPQDPEGEPGAVRLVIPAGFMVDSATGPGGPAQSAGVTYTLVGSPGGAQSLRVDVDDGWLDDPGRVWPVSVDPSLEEYPAASSDDTYVVEGESGVFHHTETSLKAGWSGAAAQRALLGFSIAPTADVAVHYAELVLTPVGSCPSTVPLRLSAATSAWAGSSVSWPGPSTADPLLPDAVGLAL